MPSTPPRLGDAGRRTLGAFLRSRRERLSPAAVGLGETARRRTPGLRREEVAALSGVSLSWLAWLEQGRDINVSRQVLGSLARTLRLSPDEQRHLYRLAGELPPRTEDTASCPALDENLLTMVNALDPNPACVLDQHWDILAWNRAEQGLYSACAALPPARRNMLWLVFGWPPARTLMLDWEEQAPRILAQFRVAADEHPDDPRFAEILAELRAAAPDFPHWWDRHDVVGYQVVLKGYQHPRAGRLLLRQSKLLAAEDSRIHLVARFPADEVTAARLPLLLDGTPADPPAGCDRH
ncbi:helix-turn-helix transcriptional regulator [Kitasatospora sp. RB6PN24]|uniref:helix-turn-helix transcriptional regulator n=1 Tax=Kitasatospora humi TaxID=2893891 RepID=UPI001E501BB7|nr:helix-turn-helix transcriptional regulator [Kitasatospora humi]MCC9307590.1 helix-turn-helix transcriptional regulator [Kitasatospora humi]